MRLLKFFLALAVLSGSVLTLATAKPDYAKKEAKACTFCHPAGKFKEFTEAGKYSKEHNHSLEGYKASAGNK